MERDVIVKFHYPIPIPFRNELEEKPGLWFNKVRSGANRVIPDNISVIHYKEFLASFDKVERPYKGKYIEFDVVEDDGYFTVTLLDKVKDVRSIRTFKGSIPERYLLDCFPALWINLLDRGGITNV